MRGTFEAREGKYFQKGSMRGQMQLPSKDSLVDRRPVHFHDEGRASFLSPIPSNRHNPHR